MNALVTLVKREYWENRTSFLMVPAVVAGIIILLTVCSLFMVLTGWHKPISIMSAANVNKEMVRTFFYSVGVPFVIVMWLIIANYFLGCLYDDRKDKSILFWQSMPITETQVVLSKVIAGLILAPICTFVVLIITQLISLVLDSIIMAMLASPHISGLWNVSGIVLACFSEILSIGQQILWMLPFVAWFMCVSAFAKKSPFLRALVPIIILLILDGFFGTSHYFSKFVGKHLLSAMTAWSQGFGEKASQLHGYFGSLYGDMSLSNHLSFIVGIIVAIIGFVAAIIIRKKSENL